MKTLCYSIIVVSFTLVLILPSTVFATMLYNNNDILKQFNTNSIRMTKLVHDGTILITTQTIKKTEYNLGEKILVHPTLTNIGNKSMNISYMWHPFFFVIDNQNGSTVWANGPSVPMMEYSSNRDQTLAPNVPFTSDIHDVEDSRYPTILDTPGNYTISSVADFYGYGTPRNLVWSEPLKFTVLPEKYSVADMNMVPPLQQFLSGIPAISVKCGDGLELLIKTNTGLPVCIKQISVTKIVERGWATKAPSQIPVVIMPPAFDDSQSHKTFEPSLMKVVIGINNTVRWTNKASTSDTLTSDGFKESNSFGEIFGGSTISPGDTYEFTFTKPGTFGYHEVPHSWNKGKIIVLSPNDDTDILAATTYSLKQITHYYDGSTIKPKVELYDYYYDGIDKDNAIVSINNHTYYQTTLNYTDYDLKKGTSIKFQNVTFAFPEGIMTTPGGAFIMLDIKFPDGSEEIYGENKKNPDGSGALGGIGIPTQYGPHLSTNSTTVLGNHVMPQAGMTIYNDKIKLLVSIPQLSEQLTTACPAPVHPFLN